ncbi:hypothetical protein [Brevibacillus brevis]|uniref:hypothetical protein n=2 Tax=Brevibacillus TaxID=55080 RepID=UPI000D108484|nr:hypothetical protein [Brevibacillus brevis]PSJ67308.1 hypothetical protein C7J99_21245 [Brevibacillus brevis]RED21653.1 hypothetical protein DES34_11980 [Brevibacillus brevis]GEC91901.1 hypothetical protein BBR01nite_42320 [Brevibacillus brevis]VEF86675.1 Uncharacterised protein [Brevibacillus brevis]
MDFDKMDFDKKLQLKLSSLLETTVNQLPDILARAKKSGVEDDTALLHAALSGSLTVTANLLSWYHKEIITMIEDKYQIEKDV